MKKGDTVSVNETLRLAKGVVISPKAEGEVVSINPGNIAVDFEIGRGVYQRVHFGYEDSHGCNVRQLCVKNSKEEGA